MPTLEFSDSSTSAAACPKSEWVDPQTPASACSSRKDAKGQPVELVFSDEFNVPGRTFADGNDPVWTAITGFPSSNNQENAYDDSPAHATTKGGNLVLSITNTPSELTLVNYSTSKRTHLKRPYTSAMLQTWNKFCFIGGVVELSAKLPGKPEQPGLWPAFWLLGNLGRATIEESLDNVWPFSYSQCPPEEPQSQDANQHPRKQQKINKCIGSNWTQRFGLNPNQGRGALEIDILEIMPGNLKPNYKEDKVDPGFCPPQTELVYQKLDRPRPILLNTLQAAPGIPYMADQRPRATPEFNASCVPEWGKEWYDDLRPENIQVYGPSSTLNADSYGRNIVNKKHFTEVEIQIDSLGAVTSLPADAFEKQHVYSFEWDTAGSGELRFFMDGKMLYRLDGAILDKEMVVTRGGKRIGTMLPRKLLFEPMAMLLNIDMSKQWGWDSVERKCKNGNCGCCMDCSDNKCLACMMTSGSKNDLLYELCQTLPAELEIDYVRVYQSKEDRASDRQGCSPKAAPTEGWIESHRSDFVAPNYDAPLQPVFAGGARCETDANCGGSYGAGTCFLGTCHCSDDWTGPSCLARRAGAALTCQPLERELVGGGFCDTNKTFANDQCGSGECVEFYTRWDAPQQKTWLQGDRLKPVGVGNGRCSCQLGWAGPFCNRKLEGEEAKKHRCLPSADLGSPQLETLISRLCQEKRPGPRLEKVCSDVLWKPHWESGGVYSQCGAWPRASWVVHAMQQDTGLCCTSIDPQSRKVCSEEAEPFQVLLLSSAATLIVLALCGCLRQTQMRRASTRSRAIGNDKLCVPGATEVSGGSDEDTDGQNGFDDTSSEDPENAQR